ncbi:ParB/RepB/Spo0J family partition protein [Aquabacterium sp. OR-4]|uniref:ParB/RepB/Spo0J family partition protein n=1 Tax=Aquabacterium sp. OR-4 TaxID=2978127 RepID=UPI0028CA3B09|nr:ParB/RepB/Spo0J family partition protein [Aquabacterium sp. OR-4]MDT7837468.1 ParB/RepB/Spo0J family partition protein [Aquabacterium sp. OR-4]
MSSYSLTGQDRYRRTAPVQDGFAGRLQFMMDPPEPLVATAPMNDAAALHAGVGAGAHRSARLDQAVRGVARAAMKRGEKVVQIRTTIKLGQAQRSEKPKASAPTVLLLDPRQIDVSRWFNRHDESYRSDAFQNLKRSIQHDGENHVPVLVRALPSGRSGTAQPRYELVYGHRRRQACLELGLPVRAIVEKLAEGDLVRRAHAENRDRAPLSAYEAGLFYKQLMDAQLYSSQRQMAEALGIDQADAGRKMWLAGMPADLIAVFRNPVEIGCDDAKRLRAAWTQDAEGLLHRARGLLEVDGPLPARQAIVRLVPRRLAVGDGGSITQADQPAPAAVDAQTRAIVEIQSSGPSAVTLRVHAGLSKSDCEALVAQVTLFLHKRRSDRSISAAQ